MKSNVRELAADIGVSASTVSRVLSGKAARYRISRDTIDKVSKAAEDSFYRLGVAARKRKSNGSGSALVGLLVPSLSDPYFGRLAGYVVAELGSKGYLCTPFETNDDEATLRKGAEAMLMHGIQALIAIPSGRDNSYLEQIDKEVVPVVLLDHFYAESRLSYVTSDNFGGALSAVRYLISRGHRDILCIQGDSSIMTAKEREKGYLEGMREAGLSDRARVIGGKEFSVAEGYRLADEALDSPSRPTAIFTLSHALVVGAIRAVNGHGLKIPSEMALMSFDNNIHTDHIVPCVRQPIEDMARLSTELVLKKLENGAGAETHIRLSPELVMADGPEESDRPAHTKDGQQMK